MESWRGGRVTGEKGGTGKIGLLSLIQSAGAVEGGKQSPFPMYLYRGGKGGSELGIKKKGGRGATGGGRNEGTEGRKLIR